MPKYDPKAIEPKWQKQWKKDGTFEASEDSSKPKFYGLIEFPYPSGAGLHVGHPRPFTAMDVITRKRRMEGFNVLYPIGFDAFGLPTENYAIKTGRPPAEVTAENIANFTRQLTSLGYGFDWSRAVDTTDPKYFKWTQWIFLQLYKHGLAYKKNQPINWCPKDKIGLANEEVVQGCCERCGTAVEQRNKEQWMLAITQYADKLLEGLKEVDYITPARIQQENWIGKSEGAEVQFFVKGQNEHPITVFTTRPDTIFGVTYIAVSAELAKEWLGIGWKADKKIVDYIEKTVKERVATADRDEAEKTGISAGFTVANPANGEEVPVWITNYVMGGVGTGAIMGVPAHDERDFEFAKKFGLAIKPVVIPSITFTGDSAPRQNVETIERRVVDVIIENNDGKFLLLKEDNNGFTHYHFVGGGTDGESDEAAVKREALEETGYTDFEIKKQVTEDIYSFGFRHTKNKNQKTIGPAFHVKLLSEKRIHSEVEDGKHSFVWVEKEKVRNMITWEAHLYMWEKFLNPERILTGDGMLINSGTFNGLDSGDARKQVISWLEEKKLGKRKVNFKLRDWVFSRQRYWGEPIPLVHCDACANKKYTIVLVHGFEGSVHTDFFPWLKQSLEKQGHTVIAPELPNPAKGDVEEQVKFVLEKVKFDKETILLGHSLGGVVAMKVLERLKTKISKLVLIDSFVLPGENRSYAKTTNWEFDFKKIRSNTEEIVSLVDSTHAVVSAERQQGMSENLQAATVVRTPVEDHFCAEQEPEILKLFEQTGWIPLPESELPLELPKVKKYEPTDTGESPLATMDKWVNTKCPRCGSKARRETDTMPNWAGSSWYFLRYIDPKNDKALASKEALKYWTPVDWYNGGMEHTVLHLLYSRFWNQFLFDIGVVPTREPYKRRTSHGMILGPDGEKMSKSRGNVINPDEMVEQFGADAFRSYIMFMGPFDQFVQWDTNGLVGVRRFIDRVWNLQDVLVDSSSNEQVIMHQTIKKVGEDIDKMSFNTAIAKLMELVNHFSKEQKISREEYGIFAKLLSPFAPHVAEEIWSKVLGNKKTIAYEAWPTFRSELTVDSTLTLAIQINGKVRDTLDVPADITEEQVKELVLKSEKVQKWLEGKSPKKIIYVKGKLVSVVI